jgi:hypothetical protein
MSRIGKISISEKSPSTCNEFYFWLDSKARIKPFDIIKVHHIDESITFGMIKEISHISDSSGHLSNYISSDFGDLASDPETLRLGMTYAKADVIGNTKNIEMPVLSEASVEFASPDEIIQALGLDKIENKIPAGFIEISDGTPVPIGYSEEFILGPDGAHLNISGISGLATKTSYAMFLLQAMQQKCQGTASIIINVKGRDLLHINEENPDLTRADRKIWKNCGLECKPFDNVKFFYPFDERSDPYYSLTNCRKDSLEKQHENNNAFNFIYSYEEDLEKLDLLFSNIDDPNLTWDAIMNKFQNDFRDIYSWKQFFEKIEEGSKAGRSGSKEIPVQSWRKFKRITETVIKPYLHKSIFQDGISESKEFKHVHLEKEINQIKAGDVFVIDIENMPHIQHQYLVIGDIFKSVKDRMLGPREGLKRIIIFFDELNKFAPANAPKNSPILLDILDVAERGRSLGVILFSAQQFKSSVFDRVKGNCSTLVYGRTNATEVSKSDYRFIPKTILNIMTRLEQGELIAEHPVFRSMLKIKFPFPSYDQAKEGD